MSGATGFTVDISRQEDSHAPSGVLHRKPYQAREQVVDHFEGESDLLLKVEDFLTQLEQRLDHLEKYGNLKLDQSIERAWSTLQDVRAECGRIGGEVLDQGKRRAHAIVEILESRYQEALEAPKTLPGKVAAGVHFLDELLEGFESRAHASLDRKIDRAKRGMETVVDATEHLAASIERAIQAAKERHLITYEELPVPWRANPHILTGYRFTEHKIECVKSAFLTWSNETCNIWTHGLGFVMVLAIAFYFYPTSQMFSYHSTADKFVNAIFFFAAAKAMACSAIWHTFSGIAHQHTMERFACADYSGISLLIATSIITTEYTAFYNDPISRAFYIGLTFVLGTAGVIIPWKSFLSGPGMRVYRTSFYIALGASGAVPAAQLCYMRGISWVLSFYLPVLKSVLVYLIGAGIYTCQIPERWYPGCFDRIGGSHNIFHCLVVCGILYHWYAMHDMFHLAWNNVPVSAL